MMLFIYLYKLGILTNFGGAKDMEKRLSKENTEQNI